MLFFFMCLVIAIASFILTFFTSFFYEWLFHFTGLHRIPIGDAAIGHGLAYLLNGYIVWCIYFVFFILLFIFRFTRKQNNLIFLFTFIIPVTISYFITSYGDYSPFYRSEWRTTILYLIIQCVYYMIIFLFIRNVLSKHIKRISSISDSPQH